MVTRGDIEMSTYSPAEDTLQPRTSSHVLWSNFESAAKARYGANIRVIKTPYTTKQLDDLMTRFEVLSVTTAGPPREVRRTVVDVNIKEYTNNGQKMDDESTFKVSKQVSQSQGNRFHFSDTKGSHWDVGGNIGAQVIGMAMGGVTGGVSAGYGRNKSSTAGVEQSSDSTASITYEQEERMKVPPGTRVRAIITSFKVKYEQQYTIKFGINSWISVPLKYKTRCQQICCGANSGAVEVTQIVNTLPGYSLEGTKATISVVGTLSWISEGFSVDKSEQSLI